MNLTVRAPWSGVNNVSVHVLLPRPLLRDTGRRFSVLISNLQLPEIIIPFSMRFPPINSLRISQFVPFNDEQDAPEAQTTATVTRQSQTRSLAHRSGLMDYETILMQQLQRSHFHRTLSVPPVDPSI